MASQQSSPKGAAGRAQLRRACNVLDEIGERRRYTGRSRSTHGLQSRVFGTASLSNPRPDRGGSMNSRNGGVGIVGVIVIVLLVLLVLGVIHI